MTTNAGAAEMARPAIGFGQEMRHGDDLEAINKMFTPEFRNRLDSMIGFARLTPEIMSRVVDKFVLQLEIQLAERQVKIIVSDEARTWLGEKGYDETFGARPLGRVIQENIKKPLADELLFGRLAKGGTVRVKVVDSKLAFDYTAAPPSTSKPDKPEPKVPAAVE